MNGTGAKAELVDLRGFVVWGFLLLFHGLFAIAPGLFCSVNELKTQVSVSGLCCDSMPKTSLKNIAEKEEG